MFLNAASSFPTGLKNNSENPLEEPASPLSFTIEPPVPNIIAIPRNASPIFKDSRANAHAFLIPEILPDSSKYILCTPSPDALSSLVAKDTVIISDRRPLLFLVLVFSKPKVKRPLSSVKLACICFQPPLYLGSPGFLRPKGVCVLIQSIIGIHFLKHNVASYPVSEAMITLNDLKNAVFHTHPAAALNEKPLRRLLDKAIPLL
jgi:hypothetical protein